MKPKVYIDGKDGTTGLQIYDRLAARDDIGLLLIDEAKRKDPGERKRLMAEADIVFLCLPDAAAVEAVALAEGSGARMIDASTAHRTAPGWVYGFPELRPGQREAIAGARHVPTPAATPRGSSPLSRRWFRRGCCPRTRTCAASPSPATPAAGRK